MVFGRRARADRLNSRGLELEEQGELEQALEAYLGAAAADPSWSVPWFNLGLQYKLQRRWELSRDANLKASKLDPEDEGARWNLGIACTALGEAATAREAWTSFGVQLPPGEGFVDARLGPVPIRLDPGGQGEVVWCHRLDPARARIENIPMVVERRWGDLLLHDGEPKGSRKLGDHEVPVFEELQVLETSPFRTWRVDLRAPEAADFGALEASFDPLPEVVAEDWSRNVRFLCRACSEGTDGEHEHPAPPGDEADGPHRVFGLAAASRARAEELLRAWVEARPGRLYSLSER